MVYCGTGALERIMFHDNELDVTHWIDMAMSKDDALFQVTCCCDEDFVWEFYYSKSDYDRVKFIIMNAICERNDVEELLDELEEIFVEDFDDILVGEDGFECDGDCDNCCNCDYED